jgi:hypothetical protein
VENDGSHTTSYVYRQSQTHAQIHARCYDVREDVQETFTCNPSWTDVKENLTNDHLPTERHDLIARVFKQKQLKLIDVITKGNVFGVPRCWMYMIEWQKRGLPYSHNLIWLADKIQPTQIDVISAKLPDPTQVPELSAVVTRT